MSNFKALKEMVKSYVVVSAESKAMIEEFLQDKLVEAKIHYDVESNSTKYAFKGNSSFVSFILKNNLDTTKTVAVNENTLAPVIKHYPTATTNNTATNTTPNTDNNDTVVILGVEVPKSRFRFSAIGKENWDKFTKKEQSCWIRLVNNHLKNKVIDIEYLIKVKNVITKSAYNKFATILNLPLVKIDPKLLARELFMENDCNQFIAIAKHYGSPFIKKSYSNYSSEEIRQIKSQIKMKNITLDNYQDFYPDMLRRTFKKIFGEVCIEKANHLGIIKETNINTNSSSIQSTTTLTEPVQKLPKPEVSYKDIDLSSIPMETQAGILNDLINDVSSTKIMQTYKVAFEIVKAVEEINKDFIFSRKLNMASKNTTKNQENFAGVSLDDRIDEYSKSGVYYNNKKVNLTEENNGNLDLSKLKTKF